MIANADGWPLIAPCDLEKDARRRAIFVFVPMKGGGDEIAVAILATNDDDGDFRQKVLSHPAAGVRDEAIGGKLLEHALQVDPVRALDVESAGDFTPPDVGGGGSNELKNIFVGWYF